MRRRGTKIRIAIHRRSALSLFLMVAVVALPLSMAQACQTSTVTESACCRAMRFACHTGKTPYSCCMRNGSVPAPGVMNLPIERASVRAPVFAVACLLPPAVLNMPGSFARDSQTFSVGYSPPGKVRVFLLNSTLLI
jgi:hypothetical protein